MDNFFNNGPNILKLIRKYHNAISETQKGSLNILIFETLSINNKANQNLMFKSYSNKAMLLLG
jgi:hypothetical protein